MKKTIIIIAVAIIIFSIFAVAHAASGLSELYYQDGFDNNTEDIDSFLEYMGYTNYRYEGVSAYYVRRTMDDDIIFTVCTAAEAGIMYCNHLDDSLILTAASTDDNNARSLDYEFDAGDFDNMDLAYYLGSCTANTSTERDYEYGNLTTMTIALGAETVYSYEGLLGGADATDYFQYLLYGYLGQGYNVTVSANTAVLSTYNAYGSYYGYEDIAIAGNTTNTID